MNSDERQKAEGADVIEKLMDGRVDEPDASIGLHTAQPTDTVRPTSVQPITPLVDPGDSAGTDGVDLEPTSVAPSPWMSIDSVQRPKLAATVDDRDLRPVWNIQAFGGNWPGRLPNDQGNPYGLHGNWWADGDHASAVAWMRDQLVEGYDLGHRLLHIRLIAGGLQQEGPMLHSTWFVESMPIQRRRLLAEMFLEFLADRPDAVIENHVNAEITDPYSMLTSSHPNKRLPDLTRAEDIETLMGTMHPYIRIANASGGGRMGFSIDAASNPERRDTWLAIAGVMRVAGVPIRGEAIPDNRDATGQASTPATEHWRGMEWWAMDGAYESDPGSRAIDPNRFTNYLERRLGVGHLGLVCGKRERLTVAIGKTDRRRLNLDLHVSWVERRMRNGWRIHPFHDAVRAEAWRVFNVLQQEARERKERAQAARAARREMLAGGVRSSL
jgi:hypothetical protein